ncbi:MAG TPA: response regulator transcription factor, partial [Cyclobacteriaceae bacterium]
PLNFRVSCQMKKIQVIIADDHKIIRVGLRGLLEREKDIEVTGEAENGNDLLLLLKKEQPDVILMDIDMGTTSGIDATREVKKNFPAIQVLGLTMHEEQDYIVNMLEAGASGYLLKNAGREELLTAIHTVNKGDSYFSQKVSATLLQAITKQKETPTSKVHLSNVPLSDREIEVLKLIAEEHSNGEIAEKLFISVRTVDTHRRNLLEKLNVKNTAGLVKYALEKGIL